jgi:serum/glucocorticoid-regulated kinase 2
LTLIYNYLNALIKVNQETPNKHVNVKLDLSYFDILALIGDGLVGKVFQVRLKSTGKVYAMKAILKEHVVQESLVSLTQTERYIPF